MKAFPAAKRTLLLLFCSALLVAVVAAQAADHPEDSRAPGYLGVMLQDLTPSMAKALQLDDSAGVLVNDVVDEGPAASAGLEEGDVILEFNGHATSDYQALTTAVRATSPGDMVSVVVLRGGSKKNLDVKIGEREHAEAMFFTEEGQVSRLEHFDRKGNQVLVVRDGDFAFETEDFLGDRGFLGVHLDDLNEQLGEYFGVDQGQGALVTEVVADSPAATAGLQAGDVIIKVGEEAVGSSSALHVAMAGTEAEQKIAIEVVRKGKNKNFTVTLAAMPADSFARHMEIITEDSDFAWHSPRMMKHFGGHGDVDVKVIRRGAPHPNMKRHELHLEQKELTAMREELDLMRQELDKIREDLKK